MKKCKWIIVSATLLLALFLINSNAHALSQETELLLRLLEKKGIISKEEAATLRQEVEAGTLRELEKEALKEEIMERLKSQEQRHYHSVKGLAERLKKMEAEIEEEPPLGAWPGRIELSGLIEVEASSEDIDHVDPAVNDEQSSDIVLATLELGVDADIAKHVKGHILFLFEEDDTEPIEVDEGIISIDGGDALPLYLNAGRMYVPFGRFESHFISDPLTLELGETRESAVMGGFANDWVELSLGTFNGDTDETGEDNRIQSYVASCVFSFPEEKLSGLALSAGASYITNIADSDGLQEVGTGVSTATIKDHVSGLSVFISASLKDKFFFDIEYLGATEGFQAGELSFDGGKAFKPNTWNLELAYAVTEELEVALKYEGGDDLGEFLPNKQYGAALIYGLFENTSLAVEYLDGEYENNDERSLATAQLAIEF